MTGAIALVVIALIGGGIGFIMSDASDRRGYALLVIGLIAGAIFESAVRS